MFDSVFVPCPKCTGSNEFQSKSGDCDLAVYSLVDVPTDVLEDINRHAPIKCGACGTRYRVAFEISKSISHRGVVTTVLAPPVPVVDDMVGTPTRVDADRCK